VPFPYLMPRNTDREQEGGDQTIGTWIPGASRFRQQATATRVGRRATDCLVRRYAGRIFRGPLGRSRAAVGTTHWHGLDGAPYGITSGFRDLDWHDWHGMPVRERRVATRTRLVGWRRRPVNRDVWRLTRRVLSFSSGLASEVQNPVTPDRPKDPEVRSVTRLVGEAARRRARPCFVDPRSAANAPRHDRLL
jgi:hypothetical protein